MILELWWSDKIPRESVTVRTSFQQMANRLLFGFERYERKNGGPSKKQKYFSRLKLEAKAYAKTGNAEHLLNIANYAYLETQAPEHKRFHFDDKVESVTRRKFGGEKG